MKKRTVVLLSLGTALILGAVVASYFTIGGDSDGVVAPNGELVITDGPSRDVLPQDDDPPDALFGYNPDPQATRQFLRELPAPTIREAGPGLFQARGPPEDVFLYRALYKAHQDRFQRDYVVVKQGIGDCVGHGFANGCDVHLAVMWSLGDSAEWWPSSSESVYGGSRVQARGVSNGGWSDGSYGSAAAKFLRDWGIGFRKDYGDGIDLTVYSAKRAKDWGYYGAGGQGQPSFFIDDVKKHPVRSVALVTDFDEAAAAIQSGYPIPVCSMVGFTSTRDGQGFARASGTWAHCMCFLAVRHGDRPGLLCLNSWGPTWINGPKWPDDQPDGSFWVDKATVNRMLAQRDSFVISGYDGFPFRKLDHAAWVEAKPKFWEEVLPSNEPFFALAP